MHHAVGEDHQGIGRCRQGPHPGQRACLRGQDQRRLALQHHVEHPRAERHDLAAIRGAVAGFDYEYVLLESIAVRLASREGISTDEARESLMEVGLEEELDLFDEEADVDAAREVLEEGATKLVEELRMSMDFYGAQEGVTPVDRVAICGSASTIPGLPERIQQGLGLGITFELPPALSHLDAEDAARLTVSYGLALGE